MMKHICIFSANYLPNTGGVERYTYNLSRNLALDGYKVTIVTSNVFSLAEHENINESIDIFRLPCIKLINGRFPVLNFFSGSFKNLNRLIKSNFYDLTIVNTRFYIHSLYGAIIGKKKSRKVILIEHGSAHLTVNNKLWDFLGQIFEHSITAFIKHFIKDFYGVSSKCNEWLLHFGIKAKGTLYNAVDISEIEEIRKTEKPFNRAKLGIPDNAKIIAFTGRLVYEKGIGTLVDAVKILNSKYNREDIHLIAAGDGPLYDSLIAEKNPNIHFIGKQPFNKIVPLLDASDVFCLPTRSEGFTTSGLEAACCMSYIIATPVGGITELLLDASYGTLLPVSPTPENIAKTILNVLKNDKNIQNAIKKCYNSVEKSFTWKETTNKIEKLI